MYFAYKNNKTEKFLGKNGLEVNFEDLNYSNI